VVTSADRVAYYLSHPALRTLPFASYQVSHHEEHAHPLASLPVLSRHARCRQQSRGNLEHGAAFSSRRASRALSLENWLCVVSPLSFLRRVLIGSLDLYRFRLTIPPTRRTPRPLSPLFVCRRRSPRMTRITEGRSCSTQVRRVRLYAESF
jgi:hypothetical protein